MVSTKANAKVLQALAAPPEILTFDFNPGWHISATSGKILSSTGAEREKYDQMFPEIPDMFFYENALELTYKIDQTDTGSCAGIRFTAADALACVKHEAPRDIKVAAADVWSKSREHQLTELRENHVLSENCHQDFDWTFNTNYKGSLFNAHGAKIYTESTQEDLDWKNLQRRDDPIIFSASVPFFEDELEDFGCAQLLGRIRVMSTGFFLLLRYFLRVDNVKFVSNETRVRFVVPNWHEPPKKLSFLRTFVVKEGDYHAVSQRLGPSGSVTDADQVASVLDIRSEFRERVHIDVTS